MNEEQSKDLQTTRPTPNDLLLKILKDANVTPDLLDDGGIVFHYGDEHNDEVIVARPAANDSMSFFDYNWHEISQWDIEAVTDLQNKINHWNIGNRVKIVYHFDDDDMMQLTTIASVPFTENIPDLRDLLTAELQCLVDSHTIIPKEEEAEETVSDENKEEGAEQ